MPNDLTNSQNALTAFSDYLAPEARLHDVIPAVAHPMNQGLDGISGRVLARSGEPLFLKVLSADQKRWCNWDAASEIATNAGNAGISPKLIARDQETASFLFEYLHAGWRPAIVLDLRDAEVRSAIISATRKLHELAPLKHSQPVRQRITSMRKEMEAGARHIITNAVIKVTPPEHYAVICAVVDQITQAFTVAGQDTAPCHIENSLSNFMLGPSGAVRIVDFDRAANADPLSDIGALCNEYYRTDDDVAQSVEHYTGHTAPDIIARVKLQMILSAFYWGMWGKVSQFSTDRTEIEYYKYGENQFVRCGYYLSIWDVEHLIGEI